MNKLVASAINSPPVMRIVIPTKPPATNVPATLQEYTQSKRSRDETQSALSSRHIVMTDGEPKNSGKRKRRRKRGRSVISPAHAAERPAKRVELDSRVNVYGKSFAPTYLKKPENLEMAVSAVQMRLVASFEQRMNDVTRVVPSLYECVPLPEDPCNRCMRKGLSEHLICGARYQDTGRLDRDPCRNCTPETIGNLHYKCAPLAYDDASI